MRALASFAMRNRPNAIMVAAVSAMLAVILPPLAYFGSATIGLVTLRQGPRGGMLVIVWAFLALAVLGMVILQNPLQAVLVVLGLWLPLWIVSWVLRETVSLALALEAAAVLGLVALVCVYVILGDPVAVWREMLGSVIAPALEQAGVSKDSVDMQSALDQAAQLMNGVFAASFTFSIAMSLLLARWWQAVLYNPGGMREEFHALRLHQSVALVAVAAVLAAFLLPGGMGQFMTDVSLTLSVLFLLQGFAVVHGIVGQLGANIGWLVVMYALLVVALPQVFMLLAVLGVVDTRLDLRARFPGKAT